MTVSKEYNKHIYEGNGLTRDWPYDFDLPITAAGTPDTSLIHVFRTNLRGEVTEVTAFSVDAETGTLTYPTSGSPLESGEKLTILRELPVSQQFFDPSNQSNLYPETLEDATDRLVMMVQQVKEDVQRSIKLPVDREGTDEEVNPIPLLNARDEAVSAANSASASEQAAGVSEARARSARDAAILAEDSALDAASRANGYSDSAAASAVFAHAAEAPAWSAAETYNFPDVVANTDGHTYRCLGTSISGTEVPGSSAFWQRVTVESGRTFFEEDHLGDYMPSLDPYAKDGVDGKTILVGLSDPSNYSGNIGDVYLNKTTWEIFQKSSASVWTSLGIIKGDKGDTGIGVPPITEGSGGKVLAVKADESGYEVAHYIAPTVTPTASKVPLANELGELADDWLGEGIARTAQVFLEKDASGDLMPKA
ncbi:MAG: hypothetical protein EOM65_12675 [Synergistales bacterium]|nr:hypothetical protein [Synergistales bacterium]